MKQVNITRRKPRQARARVELIDRQRNLELLTIPAVRVIARRSRVSPATAALLVELSGLCQEASNA